MLEMFLAPIERRNNKKNSKLVNSIFLEKTLGFSLKNRLIEFKLCSMEKSLLSLETILEEINTCSGDSIFKDIDYPNKFKEISNSLLVTLAIFQDS